MGLAAVVARCRDRGYEPTFHPETGTYVEAPWEIERVLEISDVGLCLETGHIFSAAATRSRDARDWAARINHVHVKDACAPVMDGIIADKAPGPRSGRARPSARWATATSTSRACWPRCAAIDFGGWLVVEQDIFPQRRRASPRPSRTSGEPRFLAARGL